MSTECVNHVVFHIAATGIYLPSLGLTTIYSYFFFNFDVELQWDRSDHNLFTEFLIYRTLNVNIILVLLFTHPFSTKTLPFSR